MSGIDGWSTDKAIQELESYANNYILTIAETMASDFRADEGDLKESAFAILLLVVAYFELIGQLRQGDTSRNRSKEIFCQELECAIPTLEHGKAEQVYQCVRIGLYHNWLPSPQVRISRYYEDPVEVNGSSVLVNPWRLVQLIRQDFTEYVATIRDPANHEERERFDDMVRHLRGQADCGPQATSATTTTTTPIRPGEHRQAPCTEPPFADRNQT